MLHEKLAELRAENNMSQFEVAEELNVSRQAISRWETGRAKPSTEKLIALSRLYGVPLDELVGDEPARAESGAESVESAASPHRTSPRRWLAAAALVIAVLAVVIGAYLIWRGESNEIITDFQDEIVDANDMEEREIPSFDDIDVVPWGE